MLQQVDGVLLIYRPVHHRGLHSFPTRRSSDLPPRVARREADAIGVGCRDRVRLVASEALGDDGGGVLVCKRWVAHRSEEHTSELQSRRDLVCRLLLEKKKKTRRAPPADLRVAE